MIETPHIAQVPAQTTASIRFTIPREDCPKVMGPAIAEILATLAEQGIEPAGPIFSHHLKMPSENFDFEVGVPTATPIQELGRVKANHLPATKVARTVYRGSYEGLGAAWGEFNAWIAASGHVADDSLWECYTAGPETGNDPANWLTELNRPLSA